MIEIISNGSKWMGEKPDELKDLIKRLKKYTMTEYSGWFFYPTRKVWGFSGNFIEVSAVFNIETDEKDLAEKLINLMENKPC